MTPDGKMVLESILQSIAISVVCMVFVGILLDRYFKRKIKEEMAKLFEEK